VEVENFILSLLPSTFSLLTSHFRSAVMMVPALRATIY
jgi:hypothetical protein